jgi:mannosyl-glycoprotein endo-beta-N-acetylglucosaminidase
MYLQIPVSLYKTAWCHITYDHNVSCNMTMLQAVELARKYNLSLALFAPSWVHEYLGSSHFVHLEYAFWQKLWPYLYIHGPTELPFSTTFCQGYGQKLYCNGQVGSI